MIVLQSPDPPDTGGTTDNQNTPESSSSQQNLPYNHFTPTHHFPKELKVTLMTTKALSLSMLPAKPPDPASETTIRALKFGQFLHTHKID